MAVLTRQPTYRDDVVRVMDTPTAHANRIAAVHDVVVSPALSSEELAADAAVELVPLVHDGAYLGRDSQGLPNRPRLSLERVRQLQFHLTNAR